MRRRPALSHEDSGRRSAGDRRPSLPHREFQQRASRELSSLARRMCDRAVRGAPALGPGYHSAVSTARRAWVGRPTICLSMIVRDESHIVREALDSAARHIDYWVIVDTGSTDDTREVVRACMAAKGVPGELHEGRGAVAQAQTSGTAIRRPRGG